MLVGICGATGDWVIFCYGRPFQSDATLEFNGAPDDTERDDALNIPGGVSILDILGRWLGRFVVFGPMPITKCSKPLAVTQAATTAPGKWQATRWPGATSANTGTSAAQRGSAAGQRVRKWQPEGGLIALGTSPLSTIRCADPRRSAGDGRNQARRVGMQRAAEQLCRRRRLHHAAEIQHDDPVGDVAHHRQIVRDEQVGQAQPLLQPDHQVDDLRLDVHVQRRDRLVADHEHRLHRQRAGDRDALALAAGEFVRKPRGGLRRQANQVQQFADPRARLRGAAWPARAGAAGRRGSRPPSCAGSARHTGPGRSSASAGATVGWPTARRARCPGRRTRCWPAVGSSSRITRRARVDLPQPDSPTSPTVSPGNTSQIHAVHRAQHAALVPGNSRAAVRNA